MSNQESQNQGKTKEAAGVEKRRRFIKGAGVTAPVILTLSSPSVFGALCLSEIMSGNESQTGNGSCTLGNNPAWWSLPTNQGAWTTAGFFYGTKADSATDSCDNYSSGTTFNAAFGASSISDNTTTMLSIVCNSPTTLNAYLVAAFLNASTQGSNYVYTAAEVIQLQKKTLGVPPLNSILDADVLNFLRSTMNP